jgi:hypothetical protein
MRKIVLSFAPSPQNPLPIPAAYHGLFDVRARSLVDVEPAVTFRAGGGVGTARAGLL